MKKVKSTIFNSNKAGFFPRHDPYVIEVDYGRNCYSCRGFEYLTRNCRN